jgi:hypothetical protein
MTFEELLKMLPNCDGPTRFPLRRTGADLDYPLKGLAAFVAPNLSERSDAQAAAPSVVIISAAGAVGKTTVARELAYAKRTLLWDLAESQPIGQSSLSGTLLSVFGASQIASVDESLRSGQLFMVVDALDEGRVKTTQAGFEAFLSDLADYARSSPGLKFIMLGRTQIAEYSWLFLELVGVSASLYSLETFTRGQAEEYVARRIRATWPEAYERIRSHEQPFIEARDLVFDHLRRVIAGHGAEERDTAENFLGYAPVLDAVATLLAGETNYAELTSNLESEIGQLTDVKNAPAVLLRKIVETILEREHAQKILTNLKRLLENDAKRAGWKNWESLYDVGQQCKLLMAVMTCRQVDIDPHLPPQLRNKFEEHLKTWLPEHPFLRDGTRPANTVFESYLLARALSNPSMGFQSDAEVLMADASYKPSRLVADFYLIFADEKAADEVLAQHVGLLYEALMSAETDILKVGLSLEGNDPDDPPVEGAEETEGEFELIYVKSGVADEVVRTQTFKTLIRPSTRVTFGRQLRDASIIVPCVLVLGTNAQEFTIGPRVDARCRSLEINAANLLVASSTDRGTEAQDGEADVVLEASSYSGSVSKRPVARGTLRVSWPGAEAFPWTEFHTTVGGDALGDEHLRDAYRRFRRIVMTLRSHSRGQLARYKAKIEHARVLQGPLGEALLAKLLEDGVLRLEGRVYVWVPETADSVVGISWHALRLGRSSPTLNRYLTDFLSEAGGPGG